MDDLTLRNQAIHWAIESHPHRFNVDKKPTVDDILKRAAQFAAFLSGGTNVS